MKHSIFWSAITPQQQQLNIPSDTIILIIYFIQKQMGYCFSTQYDHTIRKHKSQWTLKPFVAEQPNQKKIINERELRQYIDSVFAKYDHNGDKYLSKKEVRSMMRELVCRRKGKGLSEERLDNFVESFFKGADTNSDDKVSRQEFYLYYKAQ